ncbi:carcinoembryonic antigen-related cell adhesion molecule 20-like isoform X8 [Brienomyrus brachyistius]|uniref:carcinoembryonic antigen-related cell adhesion molecule 20-like isoform X8 n=1 Tax=Brienomyrus brachyistius TaxID=42636 RepID=UPI0020B38800|nr:carcinoembryonic antigen-related cell adhesion molecule 20-like isoform X8 [Brienomyrus brachyistius]
MKNVVVLFVFGAILPFSLGQSRPKDAFPPEILVIQSGDSVVYKDDSVHLALYVDNDWQNWTCYVYKHQRLYHVIIKDYPETGPLEFMTSSVEKTSEPYIYWCKNKITNTRSSTVVLSVTDLMVKLVPHPDLPELRKDLELECVTHGAPKISSVTFYKGSDTILTQSEVKYTIKNMAKTDEGNYKCEATYMFQASTSNNKFTVKSVPQEVVGIEVTLEAAMSYTSGNPVCTCSKCRSGGKSEFYEIVNGHYKKVNSGYQYHLPQGKYACRVRWDTGASSFSLPLSVSGDPFNPGVIVGVLVFIFIVMGLILIVGYFCWNRRNKQKPEALYQEVALDAVKSDKGEGGYEELKGGKRGERSGEYDTLKGPDADKVTTADVSDTGEQGRYEALKVSQDDSKKNEYETLKGKEGKGAEGGYEALKTSKAEEGAGVYHTQAGEHGVGCEALTLSKTEGK